MDATYISSDSDEPKMTGWKCTDAKNTKSRIPRGSNPPASASTSQVVIEISSDEEDGGAKPKTVTLKRNIGFVDLTNEDDVNPSSIPPRPKKQKHCQGHAPKEPSIIVLDTDDNDSDEDYDNLHAGFNVPLFGDNIEADSAHISKDGLGLEAGLASLSLNPVYPSTSRSQILPVWSSLQHGPSRMERPYKGISPFCSYITSKPFGPLQTSYSGGRSRTGLFKHRMQQISSPLLRLTNTTRFQMADVCMSISQSYNQILFSSTTPGGTDENGVAAIDPYNSSNTLALWKEEAGDVPEWLPGHVINSNDPGGVGGHNQRKYYDVRCARFDPNSAILFASSGRDGVVTLWGQSSVFVDKDRASSENFTFIEIKKWGKETYGNFHCHDVVYRSQKLSNDRSLFAGPCTDGQVFIHSYTAGDHDAMFDFSVQALRNPKGNYSSNDEHEIQQAGATVWGHNVSCNEVFVGFERPSSQAVYHGAFDFVAGKHIYHFDDRRNGEELTLDPDGSKLALFTSHESRLFFRTYDVRRKLEKHCAEMELPPGGYYSDPEFDPEVSRGVWSPDGLLLAVGTNGDDVYVYDVRQLRRSVGPVLSLGHHMPSRSHFGTTILQWSTENCFRSPRLGLLSGGGDHYVTLWDVTTACKERLVVAELQGEVGVGHFGDLSRGEKPLVAGDVDGHVYIYDFKRSD